MFTVSCGRLPQLMKIVVSVQLMQFTNGCFPFSCGTPPRSSACFDVDSPIGGLLPVWLRASPAMVHGETTVAANPLRTVRDSVQLAWLFTVCAVCSACLLDAVAGLCVDPLPQQPTSGRFCSASCFSGHEPRCIVSGQMACFQSATPSGGIPRSLEGPFHHSWCCL